MKKKENNVLIVKKSKRTMIKAAALSVLLASAMTTVAFAVSTNMESGGYAYLNSNYSNGMRNVSAGTIRGNSAHLAFLEVTTTYQDGDQYIYNSGVSCSDKTYSSDYEWSEDYTSVHKLYTSVSNCYSTRYLSES